MHGGDGNLLLRLSHQYLKIETLIWSASEVLDDYRLAVHERKRSISFYEMHRIYVVTAFVKHAAVWFSHTNLIYDTSSYETGKLFSLKPYTYFLFVQDFHCVELVCFFMFHKHNSSEWASAQSLEPIKVIQARCALKKQ